MFLNTVHYEEVSRNRDSDVIISRNMSVESLYYLHSMYKGGAVYIMSSPNKGVLYVGVTSDLPGRIYQHQKKVYPDSFTSRYNCVMLVYYKFFDSIEEAIAEEKRIKNRKRKFKEDLIDKLNPTWKDLSEETFDYIR